jgi:hypothetical protein
VQIRFDDGGMVDLEADSLFEVEEYGDDDDAGGSVVMSFLRGAMRTITGAIGGRTNDSYRMNTAVATLGVRGTAYSLRYCDATCVGQGGEPGLYGRVDDGEVVVEGAGGEGTFGVGQFFFVPDGGGPRRIVAPPDGILDGGDDDGADGGDEEVIEDVRVRPVESGDENRASLDGERDNLLDPDYEQGENEDPVALPGVSIDAAFSGAFIGSSGFAVYESPGGGDVRRDEEGRIVGAEFDGYGFVDASGLEHTGGVTGITDPMTEEVLLEVSWGSWTAEPGTIAEGDIAGFSYAFTDPGNFTTVADIDALGSLEATGTYFDQGGPTAIDSSGAAWDVAAIFLEVDFGSGLTGAGIALEPVGGDPGAALSVSNFPDGDTTIGSIDPNDGTFSAAGLSADEGGDFSQVFEAEGALEGRFLGRNAEGALVAFELREVDGDRRVVGTRVLGQSGFDGGGDSVPIDGQ